MGWVRNDDNPLRWLLLCQHWVAWRQRRSGRGERSWIDPIGAERRAARLLRFWARRRTW
jgi:hypothetical protein